MPELAPSPAQAAPAAPLHVRLLEALAAGADARGMLEALSAAACALVPCDRVVVLRGEISQTAARVVASAGYPPADAARLEELRVALDGFCAQAPPIAPGRTELVADTAALGVPGFGPAVFGVRAAAYLLLHRGERVLGAMQLGWVEGPGRLDPGLASLLEQYGGIALDFLARTDDAAALAERLLEVGAFLATLRRPDAVLAELPRRMQVALGCDFCVVFVEDGEVFRLAAEAGLTPAERGRTRRLLVPRDFAIAEQNGDGVVEVPDLSQVLVPGHDERPAPASLLVVPLRRDTEVVGTLGFGYRERRGPFARRQVTLARGLAHYAAIALENARLFQSLEEATRLKSEFVSSVSHDLRTPLHVLIGYTDMLLEEAAGPLGEAQRDVVQRLRARGTDLAGLIDDLLDVARIEAGRMVVSRKPVALRALREALEREFLDMRPPGVALRWSADAAAVVTDEAKLKTIVRNLVSNALKFTAAGSVEVRLRAGDGKLDVMVADTGPGIPPEECESIFDMFRLGESGRRSQARGTGLGLYIVRRLVLALEGSVALRPNEPHGTVFEVRLPVPPASGV